MTELLYNFSMYPFSFLIHSVKPFAQAINGVVIFFSASKPPLPLFENFRKGLPVSVHRLSFLLFQNSVPNSSRILPVEKCRNHFFSGCGISLPVLIPLCNAHKRLYRSEPAVPVPSYSAAQYKHPTLHQFHLP